MNRVKFFTALPGLLRAGTYFILGVGAIANATGHTDLGNVLVGLASVLGLKDVISSGGSISTQ